MRIIHRLAAIFAASVLSSPLGHTVEVVGEVPESIEYQVFDDTYVPARALEVATRRDNVG